MIEIARSSAHPRPAGNLRLTHGLTTVERMPSPESLAADRPGTGPAQLRSRRPRREVRPRRRHAARVVRQRRRGRAGGLRRHRPRLDHRHASASSPSAAASGRSRPRSCTPARATRSASTARTRPATPSTAGRCSSSPTRAGSSAAATTTGAPSRSRARSTGAASASPPCRWTAPSSTRVISRACRSGIPVVPPALHGTYAGLAHPAMIEHFLSLGRHEHRAAAGPRLRHRAAPAPARARELLGLQLPQLLHAARARTPPRRAAGRGPEAILARVQGHGEAPPRGRARGDPRRRLQPHRRRGHRRSAHEPARHRQPHLLPPARRRRVHRCHRLRQLA